MMLDTIKAQCFRGSRPENISDAQLAAFVSIAAEMKVNPLLPGMLYAYPSQGAIVPMMGPDGVYMKLSSNPNVDSWEVIVYPEDPMQAPTHAVAKIYRKGVERPLTYTAVLSEWKLASNPNWNTRPRHMLSIRALKQCARQVIHGIPFDEDERLMHEAIDVTPENEKPQRQQMPKRSPKGAAAVAENIKAAEVVTEAAPVPEPAPAPAPEPQPTPEVEITSEAPAPAGPKTNLADNEHFTAACTVVEAVGIKANGAPAAKIKLTGEFEGEIYHLGGATKTSETGTPPVDVVTPSAPWSKGASVRVKLLGRENKKVGKVQVFVQEVEALDVI